MNYTATLVVTNQPLYRLAAER